jgi:GTP-binding protein HflX
VDTSDSLAELGELAATAGGEIIGEGLQKTESLNPATFIGKGKAAEFADFCRRQDVDTVIFDDDLSPAQSRNLEKIFNCKILDRTSLILDIFAQRARTREGKLQIELAQLQHLLPRLTRFWGHLSRQAGGIGMRGGEGETQLETAAACRTTSRKFHANWNGCGNSAEFSAPDASATTGRWPPSSVTRTRANPHCSTSSPARTFW